MRRWLIALSMAAALAGCSGDDEDEPGAVATAPPPAQTATETAERDEPAATAEEKARPKKERRISEASPQEKKQPASPDSGSQPKESQGKPPAGQVQATNGSPPEVTLAVIDAESAYVEKTAVARYAGLLDRLEADCTEARTQLAEAALTASHDVESQTDADLSILAVLREVAGDDPSGVCLPAFERAASRHGAS